MTTDDGADRVTVNQAAAEAEEDLVRLLARLRYRMGGGTERGFGTRLYPSVEEWSSAAIQIDLCARAVEAIRQGLLSIEDVNLWGHLYGTFDGHSWTNADLQRRLQVGRDCIGRSTARVNRVVARSFVDRPAGGPPPPEAARPTVADLQDAAALTLGRAFAERRRNADGVRYAIHDILRDDGALSLAGGGLRKVPTGRGEPRKHLKTTRHIAATRGEYLRGAVELALRRSRLLRLRPELAPAVYPLWECDDPVSDSLEEALGKLHLLGKAGDRHLVAQVLRDGHFHMLRSNPPREAVADFLFFESEILGDHYNIGRVVVLDLLEHLLEPADTRRVDIARERIHILEAHYLWHAADQWVQRLWSRIRDDPRIAWPSARARRFAVVRALERQISFSAKLEAVRPDLDLRLPDLRSRSKSTLAQLRDHELAREWVHIDQRRALQITWAMKTRDRFYELGGTWDDDELNELDAVDAAARSLGMPVRTLGWGNQRLGILCSADRPADFMAQLEEFLSTLIRFGHNWPNQVSSARNTIQAAARRRGRAWAKLRPNLLDMLALLPDDADDLLRHPLTTPKPLIIRGQPLV